MKRDRNEYDGIDPAVFLVAFSIPLALLAFLGLVCWLCFP
jgi:hypothetical protein